MTDSYVDKVRTKNTFSLAKPIKQKISGIETELPK